MEKWACLYRVENVSNICIHFKPGLAPIWPRPNSGMGKKYGQLPRAPQKGAHILHENNLRPTATAIIGNL